MAEIETDPGSWDWFEHAVDAAVKGGPKYRAKIVQPKRKAPEDEKPLDK